MKVKGCLVCRARKVKCDQGHPVCGNCQRVKEQCVWQQSVDSPEPCDSQSQNLTVAEVQAQLKKHRSTQSCSECKSSKRKCSGAQPCERCIQMSLRCEFASSNSPTKFDCLAGAHIADSTLQRQLRSYLIETFFRELYNTRSFGFIHKPTILRKLDQNEAFSQEMQVVLLSMCALATKTDMRDALWEKGKDWAASAQHAIVLDFNRISVTSLMALVLIQEHNARLESHANSFLLSGVVVRMVQALQLNLEYDFDLFCRNSKISAIEKEERRRLMYACYFADGFYASGSESLQLIKEKDMKIQLPANEQIFCLGQARVTEMLAPNEKLSFVDDLSELACARSNMGIRSYLIRLSVLRTEVLRYVKMFPEKSDSCFDGAEFRSLEDKLSYWRMNLPQEFEINVGTIYVHKEQFSLTLLLHLHIWYHQCYCDLYRLALPGLSHWQRRKANIAEITPQRVSEVQKSCLEHVCAMADVFQEAILHKREAFSEPCLAISAYEAIRIIVYYVEKIFNAAEKGLMTQVLLPAIRSSTDYLQEMKLRYPGAEFPWRAAITLLYASCLRDDLCMSPSLFEDVDAYLDPEANTDETSSPPQTSPAYEMHPFTGFRSLRENLDDKHVPEVSKLSRSSATADRDFLFSYDNLFDSEIDSWLFNATQPNEEFQSDFNFDLLFR